MRVLRYLLKIVNSVQKIALNMTIVNSVAICVIPFVSCFLTLFDFDNFTL